MESTCYEFHAKHDRWKHPEEPKDKMHGHAIKFNRKNAAS